MKIKEQLQFLITNTAFKLSNDQQNVTENEIRIYKDSDEDRYYFILSLEIESVEDN